MNIPKLERYKEPEQLKINFSFLNIIGVILLIIFLILFTFVRFWLENGYIPNQLSSSIYINVGSIIESMVLVIFIVSLHEFIHGAAFKFFGYRISYGIMLPIIYTIAEKQFIKSRDNLLAALAPLIILDIVAIGLLFIKISILRDIAIFILIFNTVGSIGDIWIAYKITRFSKDALYYDFSPKENYVYIPE